MSLFQNSVVRHYLKSLDNDKITIAYQKYTAHFLNPTIQENIRNSKEEQYQEGFLRDLFVNILGYKLNPENDYNLTTELKNIKDSKKVDGAIIINNKVTGVIELKGTNTTDLSKIEEQAFGYKNNQDNDCIYVITSNFEKIRFYIENAINHIEFNLFTLDENQFKTLYLCLSYESISRNLPKKLKDESLSKENDITKKLYKDYSQFKRELFQNLTQFNPEFEPLELFKKSQKLIDRFLFLFFAEDRHLLPPNSVRNILIKWDKLNELDAYTPLIDRFRQFFGYLNTGKDDIFAYNGGLFKPDEILDVIKIDDTLLYNYTKKLADYNFESEVDVNILGHIFENSLNEIDEIKAQLEGTSTEKSQTKRKKDGVFYTPRYITKYIVENTVGKLCEEKKQEFQIFDEDFAGETLSRFKTLTRLKAHQKINLEKLKDYRAWLLQITIVDPACGSGAFLNEALNFLIDEHRYIDELEAKLFGDAIVLTDMENTILENNLFGVDINEESVEIAKLSLWLRTAQPNRKLNDLSHNIKCGNSLIDDPEVAGDKAFNWQLEFPQIFERGGFDVVIGNPPYVRQELVSQYSHYFSINYESYSGKADLFVYFYEKALRIVKENGLVSFISSGKFFEASYGKPLIKLLVSKSQIYHVVDFKDLNVFEGISAYPLILTFQKKVNNENYNFNYKDATTINVENLNEIMTKIEFEKISIENFKENDFKFLDTSISNLVSKIETNSIKLSDIGLLPLVGVKTGYNEGYLVSNSSLSKDYIFGRDIKRYSNPVASSKIFFPYTYENEYSLINTNHPDLNKLFPKEKFETRAIIKDGILNGTKRWYEFQQINKKLNFENEYIVYPNVSLGSNFTLSSAKIIDMTGFIIPSNSKFLLTLLNSKLLTFLMELFAISRRGGYLEFKTQYISKLPIKNIPLEAQQPFIEKADQMLTLNKQLQEASQKFQRSIQREFELETLGKKLENWYELSYPDFLKELKKKKVELTLKQKEDWEDYFLAQQQNALNIQTQITQTDKAIDQMVYELYGLTPEEIEIVEKN